MTTIETLESAVTALEEFHTLNGAKCPGPQNCATAALIADCRKTIANHYEAAIQDQGMDAVVQLHNQLA